MLLLIMEWLATSRATERTTRLGLMILTPSAPAAAPGALPRHLALTPSLQQTAQRRTCAAFFHCLKRLQSGPAPITEHYKEDTGGSFFNEFCL